jgi:hypothetical protein
VVSNCFVRDGPNSRLSLTTFVFGTKLAEHFLGGKADLFRPKLRSLSTGQ